jgi:hypothetical protein
MVTNWHTLCMDRYSYVISEWFHGDSLQLVFLTPQWPISKVPNWSRNLQLELRGEGVWYLLEPRLANKSLVEGAGGETCETCVSPCETPTNTIFKISQALGDITFEEVFKVAKNGTLALHMVMPQLSLYLWEASKFKGDVSTMFDSMRKKTYFFGWAYSYS